MFANNILPKNSSVPGGVAILNLDLEKDALTPKAYFNNKEILVVATKNKKNKENKNNNFSYHAIIGLDLNTKPGNYKLRYNYLSNNKLVSKYKNFIVQDKQYKISSITIKNNNMVNPDPETSKVILSDIQKIKQAIKIRSDIIPDNFKFQQPVVGQKTTSFGARRIINKISKNPHSGMDIAAPKSTPVYAASSGKVVLSDNFYLSGNMIAIDHGGGLITMYAHLDKTLVKLGEKVDNNTKIGLVGSTGRVTGPHLHWTVKLNETSVDPELFL